MASKEGASRPTDNNASISLLRRLRAGAGDADDDLRFVHRVDVCAAPPELLVAGLEPVPGTGLEDDGYSSVWYFYHAKKFTNTQGKLSGHRQRAVTGGDGAGWHSERRPKDVDGSTTGGTFCNFSYGRRTGSSARSIERLGWCMVEYDLAAAAADKQQDEAQAADGSSSNYVLGKVYRSPRAKGRSALANKSTPKKRKAGGGDHSEAPPAKSIQQQEQVQQQPQGVESEHGGDFNFSIEDMDLYVDESMLRLQQQPITQPETAVQRRCEHEEFTVEWFLQAEQPQQPVVQPETAVHRQPEHEEFTVEWFLQAEQPQQPVVQPETAVQRQPEHEEFTVEWFLQAEQPQQPVVQPETAVHRQPEHEEFTVEWFLQGEQPIVEPPPGHGSEFIQTPSFDPVVPVVAEATVDDMLGQWFGGMTTASIPWSSYAPTMSYTACSGLLQGSSDPLQLPYLTC